MARIIDDVENDDPILESDNEKAVAPPIDDEADELETPAADAEDDGDEPGPEDDEDEGGVVLTIDGETVDDDDDDDISDDAEPSAVIKEMRRKLKDRTRRVKELERQQASVASEVQAEEVGPRPTLEDAEYDEDRYAEELASWFEKKRQADDRVAEAEAKQQKIVQRFEQKRAAYDVEKGKLGVPDFDRSEEAIKSAFNATGQGVILAASKEPAKVIYALSRSPETIKTLVELADDPLMLAAEVARFESRIKLAPRKPATEPERRIRGGGSFDSPERRKADRLLTPSDNDMTGALAAYRKAQRAKG
jgi:hypothetical protein